MRARLSAISNYSTSQLLTILQNWITNSSEIIVDGQVLTVTSVYFLLNDSIPVLTSGTTKDEVILFSAIASVGGLSLFLCFCCIILLVCIFMKFKSKGHNNLKRRFVIYILFNNNDVIIIIIIMQNPPKARKTR